jgi:O-antigen ligase
MAVQTVVREPLTGSAAVTTVPCRAMHRLSPAPSAGYVRRRIRRRWTALLVAGGLVLGSVALGRAVVETQAIDASPTQIALASAGVIAATAVMVAGPVACLAAIAFLAALPLLPQVSLGNGIGLFASDAFFTALVCWWLVRAPRLARQGTDPAVRTPLRGGPVLVFLGYTGLTLLYVAVVDQGRLPVSSVSWLRLVETASIGWLAVVFLRTSRDVTVVLSAIALGGAIGVIVAVAGGAGDADAGLLGTRGGGVLNPNTLGLVSGLLVLMGTFGALGPSLLHRVPLALWGGVGLVQSQSVGSLVGTSIAFLLGFAFMVAPGRRIVAARALRAAMVLVVAVAVAYGVAVVIRPSNLPTSEQFRDSSAGQRTVVAAAGLEIAERNPIIGVGWRRSEQPEIIGDPDVNGELRARFPATRNDFFPDVSPTSVHNAYVQVTADLGLIGLGLLLFVVVSLGRQIGGVLRRATPRTQTWAQLWFMSWGLLLILIWWNDNPIFGGQTETVTPAVFIGAIAGLSWTLPPAQRRRMRA